MKTIAFENPHNGHIQKVEAPLLGSFLLGPLYLLFCGAVVPALIYFFAALLTGGIAWLILPFFAESMVRKHYLGQGWKEVTSPAKSKAMGDPNDTTKWVAAGLVVMAVLCGGFLLFLKMI